MKLGSVPETPVDLPEMSRKVAFVFVQMIESVAETSALDFSAVVILEVVPGVVPHGLLATILTVNVLFGIIHEVVSNKCV